MTDHTAIAQDRDPIRQPRDLVHAVADVQHRDAAIAQSAHVREQPIDFRCRQRGSGFVEHEHATVARQRRRDLDELPLPDAERHDRRARIQSLESHQRQRRGGLRLE